MDSPIFKPENSFKEHGLLSTQIIPLNNDSVKMRTSTQIRSYKESLKASIKKSLKASISD